MGGDERETTKNCEPTAAEAGKAPNPTPMRNWFLSLSRSRRSDNAEASVTEMTRSGSENDIDRRENNRREENSVFQRLKRKVEKKFSPRRRKVVNAEPVIDDGLIISCEPESIVEQPTQTVENTFASKMDRYFKKNWVEGDSDLNLVMYTACMHMLSHPWYWGEISRHDAQRQLTGRPNGSFLVRNSESDGPQFTLSFRIQKSTLHYRLQYRDNYWHFESRKYVTIVEMIEDLMMRSSDENFICYVKGQCEMQPPFPVTLKYPICRQRVARLQDLCRRVLRTHIKLEDIEKLPIPAKLQEYLNEDDSMFV